MSLAQKWKQWPETMEGIPTEYENEYAELLERTVKDLLLKNRHGCTIAFPDMRKEFIESKLQ
jgi:hypothetical protein